MLFQKQSAMISSSEHDVIFSREQPRASSIASSVAELVYDISIGLGLASGGICLVETSLGALYSGTEKAQGAYRVIILY